MGTQSTALRLKNWFFDSLVRRMDGSYRKEKTMKATVFWVFGILQSTSLVMIIFLLFRALNLIYRDAVIGLDTQIVLSLSFPLFLLIVEYIIYKK